MDPFERQNQRRRQTWILLAMFTFAVLCIIALVDMAVLAFLGNFPVTQGEIDWEGVWLHNRALLIWTSLAAIGVILFANQFRFLSLRQGGSALARGMGAVPVEAAPVDPLRQRLRNVVEEMAIAAAVPIPGIYVLEREPGINAFAEGHSPADAAITVTEGALEKLERSELQGVVAHEFGHILNGDIRLNLRLAGMLYGITFFALAGRWLLAAGGSGRSRRRDDRGGAMLLGLALMIVGWIGLFFGRWIKAAVSREREYLADASSAQFTRNPQALAGALKKIGASVSGASLAVDSEEVEHMLFASGGGGRLFASHPPLIERIRALDPQFDPAEFDRIATQMRARVQRQEALAETTSGADVAAPASPASASGAAPVALATPATPGSPSAYAYFSAEQTAHAARLTSALPKVLERAARIGDWASVVVCYLLISSESAVRERQIAMVNEVLGPEAEAELALLLREVPELDAPLRLPLLEIAFASLRSRARAELDILQQLVERLVHADGRVSPFEYLIGCLLRLHFEDLEAPVRRAGPGRETLQNLRQEVIDLLFIVVYKGQPSCADPHAAVIAGLMQLGGGTAQIARMRTRPVRLDWLQEGWATRLDSVLARLQTLVPEEKLRLRDAILATVLSDQVVHASERELVRAVCAVLRIPTPLLDSSSRDL